MDAATTHAPSPGRLGTPQQFGWLLGVVKAVLVLNLLDAVFTLLWVGAGLAREANPVLAALVVAHPVAFTAVKLALVGGGSLLLWRCRHRPLAIVAIFGVFLVYYALLVYHLGFLGTLLAYA